MKVMEIKIAAKKLEAWSYLLSRLVSHGRINWPVRAHTASDVHRSPRNASWHPDCARFVVGAARHRRDYELALTADSGLRPMFRDR
jgi:hypothetical protein